MQLRLLKAKEAREAVQALLDDKLMVRSRYRTLGLYYHGFASYQLKEYNAAGRSLSQLMPFTEPVFGSMPVISWRRIHHQQNERQEAMVDYEMLISEYVSKKAQAAETLRDPVRYHNDPNEKARLEALVRDRAPEHVELAGFYLGVMQYEDGKFATPCSFCDLY